MFSKHQLKSFNKLKKMKCITSLCRKPKLAEVVSLDLH